MSTKEATDSVSGVAVRLLKDHSSKCWYVTGQIAETELSDHPWFIDTYVPLVAQTRSVNGINGKGSFRWIPFKCLCPECPANGILRIDTVEILIPKNIRQATKTHKKRKPQ